ncbi:MAG: sterol desaturase family protein [Inquilinaceae bacterium]
MVEDIVQAPLALKGAAIALWLALLFAAERLVPAAAPPPGDGRFGWRRLGRNAGLWLVNVALSPLIVVPVSAWAALAAPGWRPDWWGGWPGLLLDLLLLDLWIYWWHRANHEWPFLWRFHEVHHLDHFLDTTSAVRFHFGEVLLSALVRAAIIVALDIPLVSVLVFEAVVLAAALFHHSNVRLPGRVERALSRVVVTPSIHWVHHHARRADTDSNYATVLSLWDPLFRTRSRTRRTMDMKIGVERLDERPLSGLLLRPFRRRDS